MKKSEVYSKFLKAEALSNGKGGYDTMILTIKDQGKDTGREHKFENDGSVQVVIGFEEDDRELGLNITNFDSIVDIAGANDTDNWGGTKIEVYVDPKIKFGPKTVAGIRIRKPSGSAGTVSKSAPAAGGPPPPSDDEDEKPDITAMAKKARDLPAAWACWCLKFADSMADCEPAFKETVKSVGKGKKQKDLTAEEWTEVAMGATVPF